jgi:hypothetical protein
MNFVSLLIAIIFNIISILSIFYPEKIVNELAKSKREYYQSRGYDDEQIKEWTNFGSFWIWFYRLCGLFGLVLTSIAIYIFSVRIYHS